MPSFRDKIAPIAALTSAVFALSCCLPFGILAAAGLASFSLVAGMLQPVLLGASVVLLAAGLVRLVRNPSCQRRSKASIAILAIATGIVVAVLLFPQSIAGLLAGGPAGGPLVSAIDDGSLERLKAEFNEAAEQVRVIVLLSPT